MSPDTETILLPSGLNEADSTKLVCPSNTWNLLPVSTSQIRIVLSYDDETIFLPSGLKEAEVTVPVWPVKTWSCVPVAASQMRTVLSYDAETILLPSGLKEAEETSSDDFEFDLESDDSEGFSDQSETIEEISVDSHVEDSVENDSEVTVTEPDEFISEEVPDGEAMGGGSEAYDQSGFSDDSDDSDDASYEFSDEGMPEEEGEGKKKAGAMDYVRRIWDFLNRDSVQKLIGKLMKSIGKIIKHILPRSLDLSGEVGFEDPATTGKVMEICAILYGLYGDHIRIISNFDEPTLKGEALLKGRIVPGYIVLKVLGMGIRIILNKECRKLFHDIRHGL